MILVTGGCRSGKSAHAQQLAESLAPRRLYVATAEASDEAMRQRIERHRQARDATWATLELPAGMGYRREPFDAGDFARFFSGHVPQGGVLLFDCLTLWVAGIMYHGAGEKVVCALGAALFSALGSLGCPVVVVSNEVGLGGIAATRAGREFCDAAGMVNQLAASVSERVVFVVSGVPVTIKG